MMNGFCVAWSLRSGIGWLRRFAPLVVASALILGTQADHTAVVLADPAVTMSPVSGTPFDNFVVTGNGFGPGTSLKVTYNDGTGPNYELVNSYDDPVVVTVQDDGTFDLRLQPSSDLRSNSAGTWHLQLCLMDESACWTTNLIVNSNGSSGSYGGMSEMGGMGMAGGRGGMGGLGGHGR